MIRFRNIMHSTIFIKTNYWGFTALYNFLFLKMDDIVPKLTLMKLFECGTSEVRTES